MAEDPEHKVARQAAVKRALAWGDPDDPYKATKIHPGASRLTVPSEMGSSPIPPEAPALEFGTGDTGDTGDYGDYGESDTGEFGDTGDTGDYGDTGDTGESDTGDTGDYGHIGDTGDTGLVPDWLAPFHDYQKKYIYKDDLSEAGDLTATDLATEELHDRLDYPGETGTTSSSSHPNWRGTGHTMHEVVGEDMTRYFLEDPETGDVAHITGHPDAWRE